MIRDKPVDELFRILDLAYCNTLMKINKGLGDKPLTPEEMWIPLKRIEEKFNQYHLTVLLQSLFEGNIEAEKLEPKDGFAHYT